MREEEEKIIIIKYEIEIELLNENILRGKGLLAR